MTRPAGRAEAAQKIRDGFEADGLRYLRRGARYGVSLLRRPFEMAAARMLGSVMSVSTKEKVAALTFDDGPDPEFTPQLLEILERYDARGTFFCLGRHAAENPEVIRRAAGAGHCLACHTWDHPSMPLLPRRERLSQIRRWEAELRPHGQRFFRPPYGHQSAASRLDARSLGYEVIGWNATAADWLDHDARWMANRMLQRLRKGGIVLLHDRLNNAPETRYFDRKPMIAAVRILLETLSGEYRFVTIPELLKAGRPRRENWYWPPDVDWLHTLRDADGQTRTYSVAGGRS